MEIFHGMSIWAGSLTQYPNNNITKHYSSGTRTIVNPFRHVKLKKAVSLSVMYLLLKKCYLHIRKNLLQLGSLYSNQ